MDLVTLLEKFIKKRLNGVVPKSLVLNYEAAIKDIKSKVDLSQTGLQEALDKSINNPRTLTNKDKTVLNPVDKTIYYYTCHKWVSDKGIDKKMFDGIEEAIKTHNIISDDRIPRSIGWRTKIYRKVENIEGSSFKFDSIVIKEDEALIQELLFYFNAIESNYEIVSDVIISFLENYTAAKGTEKKYIINTRRNKKVDFYKKEHPKIGKNEDGTIIRAFKKDIVNKEGEPIEIEDKNYIAPDERMSEDEEQQKWSFRKKYLSKIIKLNTGKEPLYDNKVFQSVLGYYQLLGVVNEGKNSGDGLGFGTKNIPTNKFLNRVRDFDTTRNYDNITEHYKNRILALRPAMNHMEECVNKLKEGINAFDKEVNQENSRFSKKDKMTTPILSGLALDKNGIVLASCYKGEEEELNPQCESRTFELHCEYTLLHILLEKKNILYRLKGGTLFVTLEPCNKRKFYCQNPECNNEPDCQHETVTPKIPCAVRCLESGASKIYVSTSDTNSMVLDWGLFILKTGTYPIELNDDGSYVLDETKDKKKNKENRGLAELEVYFGNKGYKSKEINKSSFMAQFPKGPQLSKSTFKIKLYQIASSLQVLPFHPEIALEIANLNEEFLQSNDKKRSHFLPK